MINLVALERLRDIQRIKRQKQIQITRGQASEYCRRVSYIYSHCYTCGHLISKTFKCPNKKWYELNHRIGPVYDEWGILEGPGHKFKISM